MALALVLVASALVISLWFNFFGTRSATPSSPSSMARAEAERLRALEAEAERRRREADEAKAATNELRAELKQVKRKLHEQRTSDKSEQDLVRARTDVERAASQQLEVVRGELAHALAEVTKLRADGEGGRKGRPAPPPPPVAAPPAVVVAVAAAPAPEPAASEPPPVGGTSAERDNTARRFRELSDSDREKLERLEHQANRERARAVEFQTEVRRLKGRTETQQRVWVVTKGELDLLKDKFKALEKRLNRTLLERDLLKRAIGELERRGGLTAGRTELTQEEIATSDQGVDERSRLEAERLERRTAAPALVSPDSNGKAEPAALQESLGGEPAASANELETAP
jgi:chromosome segregation ATPase